MLNVMITYSHNVVKVKLRPLRTSLHCLETSTGETLKFFNFLDKTETLKTKPKQYLK